MSRAFLSDFNDQIQIILLKLLPISVLLFAAIGQCDNQGADSSLVHNTTTHKNESLVVTNRTISQKKSTPSLKKHKYSSKIAGSRFSTDNVFGIRLFPTEKNNLVNEVTQTENKKTTTTENVLDFRISTTKNKGKQKEKNRNKDMKTSSDGGGKPKKEADDDEEKTLAQQVADGKYGLIQNEIFSNGSKRPGILSYASNTEIPKDTKDNLGGLEKDEIWLAEDHILVLRGGNYQNTKEDKTKTQVWPPIDNYKAPNRQVKIPKNPDIPPPFPVQLTENGPVEFIKGQHGPSNIPPFLSPLPIFAEETNKTVPFPFPVSSTPPPRGGNKTFPFPVPPHLLPPFLSNLPPGATFVAPPSNQTELDEDDPSIYYPPRYDFYYPQDNTTAVPPGPLVPGIILPPPPDFFSLFENDTHLPTDNYNETDYHFNSVTPSYLGPKYLPANRKPSRPRNQPNRHLKRPGPQGNSTVVYNTPESTTKPEKSTTITYVFPENSKQKLLTTTTPPQNFFHTNIKQQSNKHLNSFSTPILVPNNKNQTIYHPLPTTSPKPNHITLPTTKTLPKQIYIITTPETVEKNRIEDIYKNSKPADIQKYELISPELHPLRSLIKPNVTVSYNGKYGRLPPATVFPFSKSLEEDIKNIHNYYISSPPRTKTSKAPSTDINSITVTPVPIIKKVRIHTVPVQKPEVIIKPVNASKATFYFYEEPSTTERPSTIQKPETVIEPNQVIAKIPIKNEVPPTTQFYYTTKSTSKTPIRQFLEETFHSSNVLPQKPQIGHINSAEIIPHNSYSEIQKMKHLNYGPHVSPKPAIKYHYVTDDNTVIIPSPNIKDLEIKNSGSIGLQNVNLDNSPIRPAPKPIIVQDAAKPIIVQDATKPIIVQDAAKPIIVQDATKPLQKPETQNSPASVYEETPNPIVIDNNDGPFIPSNYYATVRPELIHFTSQEQTLVDDITKNYFTIFGQKINSVSTTPLTPIKSNNEENKIKAESGLTYISDSGQNFKVQQIHENPGRKPGKSSTTFYTTERPKVSTTPRPSNFEKYLKELTGEDQKDYIITGAFPTKIKKGKGFFTPGPGINGIPPQLLSQGPTLFINSQPSVPPLQHVSSTKIVEQGTNKPRLPFQAGFSTTLRPVDVEIKPQYIQHVPPATKPLGIYSPQLLPQNVGLNHNFQQYLQEITGLTSPTTTRPVRVKNPNREYFPTTPSPLKPLVFQTPSHQIPSGVKPKPVTLESDILVNFKRPRPIINSEAELINIHNPTLPYDVSSNIKIVESPDLSKNPNQPYSTKQVTFGATKDIYGNVPKPEYYSLPHQRGGNSFVSYNLPGNGGHFYFITPQIIQKENEERRKQSQGYKRVNRSEERNRKSARNPDYGSYSSLEEDYSNQDFLRRSRKKI